MVVIDVFFALKELLFSPFRDLSLLWQLAPVMVLWIILIFYFATHKHEKLGWNTSLANGMTLFWIVAGTMQYIFSSDRIHFSWLKFAIFIAVMFYAIFLIYISFKHTVSAKYTYLLASHNPIFYFSIIVILFAHDMIFISTAMILAIFLLFFLILILEFFLRLILPEMKESDGNSLTYADSSYEDSSLGKSDISFGSSSNSFDSSSDFNDSSLKTPSGGIEDALGEHNLSENDVEF